MRGVSASTHVGLVVALLLLSASINAGQALHAQTQTAPAAGTSVVVRMLDAVNSANDPAGKQYRASVAKAVNAANGVIIRQGAVAAVTLTKSGSGYAAQLASVTINGQPVAVASGSASVTSAAQSAASNAVRSALGGLGHHVSAPSGVSAVAVGQRVVLPPGTTLTFVLSQPLAANSGGATASAAPSAAPAPAGGGGVSATSAPNSPVTSQPAAGGALAANIQETLLGPSKKAATPGIDNDFVVSPDGGHYAVPAMHGSRELMIVDGVDGPEFDHAAHGSGGQAIDFVFSSDGKHSAYVAQSGNDMVEVRDGKTAFTIASLPTGRVVQIDQSRIHNPDAPTNSLVHQCLISPSGAHVVAVGLEGGTPPSQKPGLHPQSSPASYYMFLDGVKSPPYRSINMSKIAFVAEKLVYAAQTTDGKWHMVVKDKPGPAHDGVLTLLVNDDNSHYAFIAGDGGSNGGNQVVVADGVPGTPHRGAIQNMTIASNGRVAYEAVVGATPGSPNGSNDLYVDEHDIGPIAQPFAVVDPSGRTIGSQAYVLFSPDGKRFAYVKAVAGGKAAVVDGKAGRWWSE